VNEALMKEKQGSIRCAATSGGCLSILYSAGDLLAHEINPSFLKLKYTQQLLVILYFG